MFKICAVMCFVVTMSISNVLVNKAFAENSAGRKLSRGVINVLTSPIEIPKKTRAAWIEGAKKTDHILVWLLCGSVEGTIEGIKRAGSGLLDVVTFPFEYSDQYKLLYQPDFVWQEWPINPESGR